jgi:hypothetical protein
MSVSAFCRPFSLAGKLGHAGQHQDDACGQQDEGREMGDHGFGEAEARPEQTGGAFARGYGDLVRSPNQISSIS